MFRVRRLAFDLPMQLSRRKALGTALAALVARPARAASTPLEAQGGQFSSFDGAQLFYRRMGKGPPVILLHSFLSDGPRTWFNTGVAQTVAEAGFSVIAPDGRAQGLSAGPSGMLPKDTLAMDVEALIRTLGLRSYRLLGYALGSRTAVRLMARGARPERCVLGGMGITAIVETERTAAINIRTIRTGRDSRDPQLGVQVQAAIRLQKLKPDALVAVLRSEISTPRTELAKIRAPVLVLDGDKDDINGSPTELAEAFPEAAAMRAPGNHFTAVREPKFAQTAAAFLKSKDPPDRFAASAAI